MQTVGKDNLSYLNQSQTSNINILLPHLSKLFFANTYILDYNWALLLQNRTSQILEQALVLCKSYISYIKLHVRYLGEETSIWVHITYFWTFKIIVGAL